MTPKQSLKIIRATIKCIREGNEKESLHSFINVLKISPAKELSIIKDLQTMGRLISLGNANLYVNKINKFLKDHKQNYSLRLLREYVIYNSESFTEQDLLDVLNVDLEIFPFDAHMFENRALVHRDLGSYDKALLDIDSAIDQYSDNIDFLRSRAFILLDNEDYIEAEKSIERARSIDPEDIQLRSDVEYLDIAYQIQEQTKKFNDLEKSMEQISARLNKIKYEHVTILGLFVAILAVVIKTINVDYSNYNGLDYLEIILLQLSLNITWLIALFAIIMLVIWISTHDMFIKRKRKKS